MTPKTRQRLAAAVAAADNVGGSLYVDITADCALCLRSEETFCGTRSRANAYLRRQGWDRVSNRWICPACIEKAPTP